MHLKELLAAELCAMMEGWDQYHVASLLGLHQPQVSALRHGRTAGFSTDRLVRLLGRIGYNVEITLREMPRRFGNPPIEPTVTVQRFNRYGRLIERPAPGPVKRVKRWSGEVDIQTIRHSTRGPRDLLETLDNRSDMDDE